MNELTKDLSFVDPSNFMEQIDDYFDNKTPSTSAIDPKRLGSKANFISKLRFQLIDNMPPAHLPGEQFLKFNALDIHGQLKAQFQAIRTDGPLQLQNIQIVPEWLKHLRMSDRETEALQKIRQKINVEKLEAPRIIYDVDDLMTVLMTNLIEGKTADTVLALLLATGRRTIEILKTAKFYQAPGMTSTGYSAMFHGQAKTGLFDAPDYAIQLLAPLNLVQAALSRVRKEWPVGPALNSTDVNASHARLLNDRLKALTTLDLVPHELRAIYAMATYELLPEPRMSLIGHVARAMGHVVTANAAFYQRVAVKNVHLWTPENAVKWAFEGAAEERRIGQLDELQAREKKITASAMRALGGSMPIIQRLIQRNQARIDLWNMNFS